MKLQETEYKPFFYTRNGTGQLRGSFKAWLKLMGASIEDARQAREKAKRSAEYHQLLSFGLVDESSSKVANGYASFRFKPDARLIDRSKQPDLSKLVTPFGAKTYFTVLPNGKLDCSILGHHRYNLSSLEPIKDNDPVEAVYLTFIQAFKQLLKNLKHRLKDEKVTRRSGFDRAEADDRYKTNWGDDDKRLPLLTLLQALSNKGIELHNHLYIGKTYTDTKRNYYEYQQLLIDHDFDDVELRLIGTKTVLISSKKYGVEDTKIELRKPLRR